MTAVVLYAFGIHRVLHICYVSVHYVHNHKGIKNT
jgi:hypothetical protein